MKLRLPFDAPLPEKTAPRVAVLLMLGVGGLVAVLVAVVFAVVLAGVLRS